MNPHLAAVLCIVLAVSICVGFAMFIEKVLIPRAQKKYADAKAALARKSGSPSGSQGAEQGAAP
jgi:hypothetical protein